MTGTTDQRRPPTASAAPSTVAHGTGTHVTRVLGVATLVGDRPGSCSFGLLLSPADVDQGESRPHPLHPRARRVAGLPGLHRHRRGVGDLPVGSAARRSAGIASPAPAPRSACCSWASRSSSARCGAGSRGACSGCGTPGSPPRRSCSSPTSATSPCAASAAATSSGPSAAPWSPCSPCWRSRSCTSASSCGAACTRRRRVLATDGDVKLDGLMLFTLFVGVDRVHAAVRVAGDPPPAGDGDARTRSTTPGLDATRSQRAAPRPAAHDGDVV